MLATKNSKRLKLEQCHDMKKRFSGRHQLTGGSGGGDRGWGGGGGRGGFGFRVRVEDVRE